MECQVADSAVFAHCLLPGHLKREKMLQIVCKKQVQLKKLSVTLRNNSKPKQFKPFTALEHLRSDDVVALTNKDKNPH